MDELVAQAASAASIEPDVARQALSVVLAFVKTTAPPDQVAELFAAIPGSAEAAAAGATIGGAGFGGLAGLFGGGLMGVAAKLTALGLGMSEMQAVGRTLFDAVKARVGEARMGEIAGGIPGLAQFL